MASEIVIPSAQTARMSHEQTTAAHPAPRFCPYCAAPFETRTLPADPQPRLVCPSCRYVHYLDPKLAVGTIIHPVDDPGTIVLVRRAIEPGRGLWVFPGGYVDRGEPLVDAALREAREECGIGITLDALVNVYSYAGRVPVIVVYAATWHDGELTIDDESLEAGLFTRDTVPWSELAFRSTREALEAYFAGRLHQAAVGR